VAVTVDASFPVSARDLTGSATDVTWPTFTTPGTNRMVVAMLVANGAATNQISTMTSGNLTWTRAVEVVDGPNNWRVEIWTAWAASVVTTEQINTTYAAGRSYNRQSVIIWSLAGSDSSGVGNTGTTTTANDGDVAITATATGSLLLAGLPYRSAGGDIGVDANSTSQYNGGGGGGFGFNERACSRASAGAGSLTLGFTTTELLTSGAMAGVEIKAAAGGATVQATASAAWGGLTATVTATPLTPIQATSSAPWGGLTATASADVTSPAQAQLFMIRPTLVRR